MAKRKGSSNSTTATKTRKPRAPRAKQQFIKTTEDNLAPPTIPEIDRAAEAYVDVRDQRMELTEEEVEKRDALLELMKAHNLTEYKYDSKVVRRVPGDEKVKVKTVKDKLSGNGEDSDSSDSDE